MNKPEDQFSIGDASARSGVSTHTIRKWEDRYGAVSPHRSAGGTRRYSESEVNRLVLLKSLVNGGHGIGSIATIETEELVQLRSAGAVWDGPVRLALLRTAVIGPTLPQIFAQNRSQMPGLEIVTDTALSEDESTRDADVIIVEIPALDETAFATLARIRKGSTARCMVVAYRYAAHQLTNRLVSEDTACLRMPLNLREVQRAVESMHVDKADHSALTPVTRRYARSVVAKVAAIEPTMDCECPRHVAELISALSDFETYSENCESKNAQDAILHSYLNIAASHARASMETALSAVAAHENIPLDQWQAQHDATGQ